MKFYALLTLLSAILMILTPAIAIQPSNPSDSGSTDTAITADDSIQVFRSAEKETQTLSVEEYLIGAVAAEMPAGYEPEALKAQAVACHSYALYQQMLQKTEPTASLKGAALSDNPQLHQGYLSQTQREEKWGSAFAQYEKKVRGAVKSVQTEIMTYEGKPICAAFFALSPGQTESAETGFGSPVPYLLSTACDADALSPECRQSVILSESEFLQRCETLGDHALPPDNPSEWIGSMETTDTGFVRSINIGGVAVSGQEFRTAFSLRSPVFTISRTDSGFRITTLGYGHLVGMSQYGANEMAKSGADHKEILHRFYANVTLKNG